MIQTLLVLVTRLWPDMPLLHKSVQEFKPQCKNFNIDLKSIVMKPAPKSTIIIQVLDNVTPANLIH